MSLLFPHFLLPFQGAIYNCCRCWTECLSTFLLNFVCLAKMKSDVNHIIFLIYKIKTIIVCACFYHMQDKNCFYHMQDNIL